MDDGINDGINPLVMEYKEEEGGIIPVDDGINDGI